MAELARATTRVASRARSVTRGATSCACPAIPVLGGVLAVGVAGGNEELLAAGVELDAPAVVPAAYGNAGKDGPRPLADPEARHPVIPLGGVVGVDEAVLLEVRVESDPEQPALALPVGREALDLARLSRALDSEQIAGVPLADEGVAVGEEVEIPRLVQARGDDLSLEPGIVLLLGEGFLRR